MKESHESALQKLSEDVQQKHDEIRSRHESSEAKFTELIGEANEGMQQIVSRMEAQQQESNDFVEGIEAKLQQNQKDNFSALTEQIQKVTNDGQVRSSVGR